MPVPFPYIGKLFLEDQVLGTAFFVHDSLIATCYHVVYGGGESPLHNVFQFQLLESPITLEARVTCVNEQYDVALLELLDTMPGDVILPPLLHSSVVPSGISFSTQGYGVLKDDEHDYSYVSALGTITGPAVQDSIRVLQLQSLNIQRGMSGSPVVTESGHVVGLIAGRLNIDISTGYWAAGTVWAVRIEVLAELGLDARVHVEQPGATRAGQPFRLPTTPTFPTLDDQPAITYRHIEVNTIAWSHDAQLIVSGGKNGHVLICDAATGGRRFNSEHHLYKEDINSVIWSPDGKQIAFIASNGRVRFWTLSSRKHTRMYSVRGHAGLVLATVWLASDFYIASGGNTGLKCWDTQGRLLFQAGAKVAPQIMALAWSPDGKYIACGGRDKHVRIWKLKREGLAASPSEQPAPVADVEAPDEVWALAWSANGERLVAGCRNGKVLAWRWEAAALNKDTPFSQEYERHAVVCMAWSSDNIHVAFGDNDGNVLIWDVMGGIPSPVQESHSRVKAIAWSPDGKYLASGHVDGQVYVRQASL